MKQRFWWPTSRRRGVLLCLVLLIGCVLRLWLWWRTPMHQAANDEVEYLAVARDLLADRGWRFYDTYHWLRAPLYPLWLAASLWLAGEDMRRAALPNIAVSSLTVYLYFLLGCEVGRSSRGQAADAARSERVGLLTAACAAALLTLATFASLWMSETLFTALLISALLALFRYADGTGRLGWLAAGGVLMGLAILTRSLPLMALPAAVVWVMLQRPEARARRWRAPRRRALLGATLFVLATVATIAPWTLRNYQAYGAFILVETGLSYNLWWFNEPREDEDTIFRTLAAIPNPAQRADYATQKGLARLREDPAIFLRKLWPNFNALWIIKPIEDRFLLTNYYQDVPLGMFVTALILDDALYSIVALLGLCGLALAPGDRRKALLGGWLLYVNAVVLLTHGEGRYRHFIFPVLLPYAAALVVALHQSGVGWPALRWRRMLATGLAVLALLWTPLVLRYPFAWARTNVERGWLMQRADWAAATADADEVLALYRRARTADPRSPDVWLAIGNFYLRRGAVEQALSAFDSAFLVSPGYVAVNVSRGDALRRLGRLDEARQAFKGFYTSELDMLDWAWQHLRTPPPAVLDAGDGLDFGFVSGMYAAEQQLGRTARWTNGRAALRLAGGAAGATVQLTLAAPRPDGQPTTARVCVGNTCHELALTSAWRVYELVVPAAGLYDVVLSTPTFEPQAWAPQTPDSRQLGVLVDRAAVQLLGQVSRGDGGVRSESSRMASLARH